MSLDREEEPRPSLQLDLKQIGWVSDTKQTGFETLKTRIPDTGYRLPGTPTAHRHPPPTTTTGHRDRRQVNYVSYATVNQREHRLRINPHFRWGTSP
jgi:hypothetical protein